MAGMKRKTVMSLTRRRARAGTDCLANVPVHRPQVRTRV